MPQQILLHFDICAKIPKQSLIGMPEGMPSNSLIDFQLFDGWMNLFPHDALSPDGTLTFSSLARKYPIICRRRARNFPLFLPHLGQERTHRDRLRGGFRLAPTDNSMDDGTQDIDFAILEVQVAPLQAKEFALAQPSRHIQKDQETRKGCNVV